MDERLKFLLLLNYVNANSQALAKFAALGVPWLELWSPSKIDAAATVFTEKQLARIREAEARAWAENEAERAAKLGARIISIDDEDYPARLLDLRERIITGKAKFENMARMYSQDPGTMMRGGEMDPTPLAGLDPAFAAALETMKPGQISEIVESQYGFHIIQLLDRRGQLCHFRHILLLPIFTSEELTETARSLDSLADMIRKDSITFEKAALEYSDDASSKMNGGVVSNHDLLERIYSFNVDVRQTVTKFLKEDFAYAPDDLHHLMQLQPGEVSDAFLTEDIMSNKLAKIVKLVEIIPTHVASLNEDYLRLEEMALSAKQERVFREWLTKKIDAMYIWIAPEFRNGEFENKHWVK